MLSRPRCLLKRWWCHASGVGGVFMAAQMHRQGTAVIHVPHALPSRAFHAPDASVRQKAGSTLARPLSQPPPPQPQSTANAHARTDGTADAKASLSRRRGIKTTIAAPSRTPTERQRKETGNPRSDQRRADADDAAMATSSSFSASAHAQPSNHRNFSTRHQRAFPEKPVADNADAMRNLYDDLLTDLAPSSATAAAGGEAPQHDKKTQQTLDSDASAASPVTSASSQNAEAGPDGAEEMMAAPSITLDAAQARAVELALRGFNLFVTGGAGTGKSQTLRAILTALKAREEEEAVQLRDLAAGSRGGASLAHKEDGAQTAASSRAANHGSSAVTSQSCVYVTATTGIAAVQLNGSTIHNFSGIGHSSGTDPELLLKKVRRSRHACHRWKRCRVLIIDEVSMLDAAVFESLDFVARRLRRRANVPFGGVQLILCGDFHQLSPIVKARDAAKVHAPGVASTALMSALSPGLAHVSLSGTQWMSQPPPPGVLPQCGGAVSTVNAMTVETGGTQSFVIPNLEALFKAHEAASAPALNSTTNSSGNGTVSAEKKRTVEAFEHASGCVYCFQTVAWARLQLWPVVLRHPHRQATDVTFQRVLEEVRRGELSRDGTRLLMSRCIPAVGVREGGVSMAQRIAAAPASTDEREREAMKGRGDVVLRDAVAATTSSPPPPPIRLCATNSAVDARNAFFFAQLPPLGDGRRVLLAHFRRALAAPRSTGNSADDVLPPLLAAASEDHPEGEDMPEWPYFEYQAYDTWAALPFVVQKQLHHHAQGRWPNQRPPSSSSGSPFRSSLTDETQLPATIALKIGTRVLLVSNVAPRFRLVNGTVGAVVGFLHPLELAALVDFLMTTRWRQRTASTPDFSNVTFPPWVETLMRRGGFQAPVDVLHCVETSLAQRCRALWFRMLTATKRMRVETTVRGGERGDEEDERSAGSWSRVPCQQGGQQLSRSKKKNHHQHRSSGNTNRYSLGKFTDTAAGRRIPYSAMYTASHYVDLERVVRRTPGEAAAGPHRREDGGGGVHRFAPPSSVTSSRSHAHWGGRDVSATPHQQPAPLVNGRGGGGLAPAWERCLADLATEEVQTRRLPIVRFDACGSDGEAVTYAMVSPFCQTHGTADDTKNNGTSPNRVEQTAGTDDDDEGNRRSPRHQKRGGGDEDTKHASRFDAKRDSSDGASRTQLPLRYAWALTVHKSQGLTLKPVQVDMAHIHTAGQAYVALSRAPSLEQLFLLNFDPRVISSSPVVKRFYASLAAQEAHANGRGTGVQDGEEAAMAAVALPPSPLLSSSSALREAAEGVGAPG